MDQQPPRHPPIARPRHDGWTHDKQAAFIVALRRTRNVSRAAEAAGMSREGAYRLRARSSAAGFAAAWDRALRFPAAGAGHDQGHEGHGPASRPVGLPAREHHESHGSRRTKRHRQLNQLPAQERAVYALSSEGGVSPARRAELLALIERAARG